MLVLGVLLLSPSATSAAGYIPKGPRFSWETLPIYFHGSNASGPVNPEGLTMMARFPLVTIEKFQGACGWDFQTSGGTTSAACDEEGQIVEVLKQVRPRPGRSAVIFLCASSLLTRARYARGGAITE